jgi:hypothetical protein
MKVVGDIINFPDQAAYGVHRGHQAVVVEADERDIKYRCSCGKSWWVAQRDDKGNIVGGED